MTDSEAREMARGLVRGSIIEDAAAQFIAQFLKHAHADRIKLLRAECEAKDDAIAELVEGLRDALAMIEEVQTYEQPDDPWTENALTMGEMDIFEFDLQAARALIAKYGEAK